MLRTLNRVRRFASRAGLLSRLSPEQRAALAARADRAPGARVSGLERVPPARPPPRDARASPYADVDRDEDDFVRPPPTLPAAPPPPRGE